jgi:hypothetical protein
MAGPYSGQGVQADEDPTLAGAPGLPENISEPRPYSVANPEGAGPEYGGQSLIAKGDYWSEQDWKAAADNGDPQMSTRARNLEFTREWLTNEISNLAGGPVEIGENGKIVVFSYETSDEERKLADGVTQSDLYAVSGYASALNEFEDLAGTGFYLDKKTLSLVPELEVEIGPKAQAAMDRAMEAIMQHDELWEVTPSEEREVERRLGPNDSNFAQINEFLQRRDRIDEELKDADKFGLRRPGPEGSTLGSGASGGGVGQVRSYLETESDKASEAARQLQDYVNRAKAIYDFQDAERNYAAWATEQNREAGRAGFEGTWGTGPLYNPNRRGPRFSDIIGSTMPNEAPPSIYRLNDAVGLPGPGGFADTEGGFNPNMGAGGLPMGENGGPPPVSGFAEGTAAPLPNSNPNALPPELQWMVGAPEYKGPLFEWSLGDPARAGFPNQPSQPRVA